MKRKVSLLLSLIILFLCVATCLSPVTAYAETSWPDVGGVQAEGACLMDAASGTVLYGKNMHKSYFPASITKILTALIVIENCDLDEELEFSHRAVYDVESGSSSAGYDEGDRITVRTALYAMLLKSANEVANALAEHTAGSIEAFCDMMNAKAAELGCTDSHFANPSGLNNENHYVSAYDYCLISRAAFENDTFVAIDGTTYYTLPASKRNPEPTTIYAHHSMLKKSNSLYYPGIIGGKTGYTTLAGNTLVTCVEKEGMKLICVVLNGHKTHYEDTKLLLDFGYENFKSVSLADYKTEYEAVYEDMDITGKGAVNGDIIQVGDASILLPKDAEMDSVTTQIDYGLDTEGPEDAVAKISYYYGERNVGHTYITRKFTHDETVVNISSDAEEEEEILAAEGSKVKLLTRKFLQQPTWVKILITVGAACLIGVIVLLIVFLCTKKRRRGFH